MTDAWMTMIFRHGFFHGDPHPANILLLDDGRIGLVDFGLAGRLTDEDMTRLTRLFVDAATENVDALPRRLAELGLRYPKEREEELRDAIEELFYRYYGSSISSIDPIEVIREGLDLIYSLNLRLPSRFVILDKAIATLGAVGVELYPDFNVFEVARPYARGLIAERFSPRRMALRAQNEVRELGGVARELPYQLRDVMEQTRQGKLEIQIRNPGFDDLTLPHRPRRQPDRGGADRPRRPRRLVDRGRAREERAARHGLHLLSFVGFVISGIFAVWLVWGIARSGRLVARRQRQPAVRPQQLEHRLVRQGADDPPSAALRVDRRPERVQHRLLGRLDDGGEERVEVRVGNGDTIDADRRCLAALARRRREGDEDLAAPVMGDRARPREAEARAPREALELRRLQRRVGCDDGDAAPCRRARVDAVADRREHRHAVDPQVLRRAEVREHEHADGRIDRGNEPAGRADAALPAERDHARSGTDAPLADGTAHRGPDGAAGVLRLDLHGARVVEPAVVALADDRDHDLVGADRRIRLTRDARRRRRRSRPTAIVEVRKMGVSISPHSEIWR